jgi:4-hydroxy-3-polyprenylbenzoate decarboxylase
MPFESLGEYVTALDKAGQLRRIKVKVNPDLEVAEILRRLMYKGNQPAVLFEQVEGSAMPILGNAFGTMERLQFALETSDFAEIGSRMTALTKMKLPAGMLNKIKMLPKLSEIADYGPKYADSGPVTEVVQNSENANFSTLPILKSFSGDAGRFITFGITVTKHPETDIRNMGVYRIQILDDKKAIMHWQIHKRGATLPNFKRTQGEKNRSGNCNRCGPGNNLQCSCSSSRRYG